MSIRWIRPRPHALRLLTRRQFVGATASSGATLLLACHTRAPSRVDAAARPDESPLAEPRAFLSEAGFGLVGAIAERILPSDDGPGAREARVIRFIDRQLATPQLRPLGEAVQQLVVAFSSWEKKHGTAFVRLPPAEQDRALAACAAGKLDLDFDAQAEVFAFLHSLTLEGFLSDPQHGGNHQGVGWRAIEFGPPAMSHAH
jgi:gluconate 2-dehydrogenase gamma chain